MKLVFGQYEHSTLGFPLVKLKWFVEDGKIINAYITIKGIIKTPWTWSELHPLTWIDSELERFDKWVRAIYSNDITVQG
jgi:hypothetical protein